MELKPILWCSKYSSHHSSSFLPQTFGWRNESLPHNSEESKSVPNDSLFLTSLVCSVFYLANDVGSKLSSHPAWRRDSIFSVLSAVFYLANDVGAILRSHPAWRRETRQHLFSIRRRLTFSYERIVMWQITPDGFANRFRRVQKKLQMADLRAYCPQPEWLQAYKNDPVFVKFTREFISYMAKRTFL